MELTEKQIYDLNNRNVASQSVRLGTILANKSGRALTEKEIYDLTNDNVVTQKIEFGKIVNAIAIGDMAGIENLTQEEQEQLNNMDSVFQNASIGSYIEEIIEGGEPPAKEYFLTFSSPSSFTIAMPYLANDGALEYSLDKESWSSWDGSETASNSNNKFYLRGSENTTFGGQGFEFNGENIFIACTGNIENLLDYQTVANGQHPVMGDTCFSNLFNEYGKTPSLVTAPTLPATVLSMGCYYQMFAYCTLLTTAPELPATTLADFCYNSMFNGCTSLTTAPELPATTLASSCYQVMFHACSSLTTAPALPATTLAENCYSSMFFGCTSLIVSDTQTAEAQYEWRIPASGVIGGTTYSQISMFTNCLGTRSSDELAGEAGQQYIYYTQNPPTGSN